MKGFKMAKLNEIKERIYIATGKVAVQLLKEETVNLTTNVIDLEKLKEVILETITELSETDELEFSKLSFHKERMISLQRDFNQMLKFRPINRWILDMFEFEFDDRVNDLVIDEVDLTKDVLLLGAVIEVAGFMFNETVKSLTTLSEFELSLITSIAKSVIEDKVEEIDITPQLETINKRIKQGINEELAKCQLPFGELDLVQLEKDVVEKSEQVVNGSGSNHFDCIKVRQRIATFETIKTLSKCKTTDLKDYALLGYSATHLFEWLGKSPADYIKPEARLIDFYDESLLDVLMVVDFQNLCLALNEDYSFYLQTNCFYMKNKEQ
jgi:hypothetical protein